MKYDRKEINNYQLLEEISKLYIPENFFNVISTVTERFENLENDDEEGEEAILNEAAYALFNSNQC